MAKILLVSFIALVNLVQLTALIPWELYASAAAIDGLWQETNGRIGVFYHTLVGLHSLLIVSASARLVFSLWAIVGSSIAAHRGQACHGLACYRCCQGVADDYVVMEGATRGSRGSLVRAGQGWSSPNGIVNPHPVVPTIASGQDWSQGGVPRTFSGIPLPQGRPVEAMRRDTFFSISKKGKPSRQEA